MTEGFNIMLVLALEAYGKMVVQERPDPVAGDGEVLISTIATGICGSDIHGLTGETGRRVPGQVMGHETVGRVSAMGPSTGAAGFSVGDLVTFNPVVPCGRCDASRSGEWQHCEDRVLIGVDSTTVAAFAQYVVVPESNVVSISETMPETYGALIEPLAVAFHAVRRVVVHKDDKILVVGGGPIGQSVILAARRSGASGIIVSEIDPDRRELCEQIGAVAIDPGQEDVQAAVRRQFGSLADVSIDAVGIGKTLADAIEATKLGGRICLVGMGAPVISLDAYQVSTADKSIVGSFTYSDGDFRDAAKWVSSGPSELARLISLEVPLEEAPSLFTRLAAHDGTPGKVLVRFDS
ncbi:alcohol dehydrogenase catalytic domain-containing protein [Salinibacterium sp. TMP30]|uniref:zinc-dependent alcohol dehydrogenase n=1 Tax=Salinibacterium sp. TMP30 TaxID=3138237 RepID=UPI0031397FBA